MAAFVVGCFGLAIGSFLNVVIGRLRSGETGWRARSRCPECRAALRTVDLIPVVSFFLLRGRCRSCKKVISWQYPLVELSTALLFLAAYAVNGGWEGMVLQPLRLVRDFLFVAGLMIVFVIDLRDMVVFDAVTLPLAAASFGLNVWLGAAPLDLLLAAAVGGGFFFLQYALSRGRWIGGGDIRIGVMMGCMLGLPGVLLALLGAYVGGALVALGLVAAGKAGWSGRVPFGTFLSAATVAVLFWGNAALRWYASLLGL